jgi:hypothetical protein
MRLERRIHPAAHSAAKPQRKERDRSPVAAGGRHTCCSHILRSLDWRSAADWDRPRSGKIPAAREDSDDQQCKGVLRPAG